MKKIFVIIMVAGFFNALSQKKSHTNFDVERFTDNVFSITEVLFHDVVNPPAAARFYAYSMLAAQQVMQKEPGAMKLTSAMRYYPQIMDTTDHAMIHPAFAAIYAMLETAKLLIPSGYSLEEKQKALLSEYVKHGVKKSKLDASMIYAKNIASQIAVFSKSDGYLKLSTYTRYKPLEADSTWFPTPPEYMAAVEPYWNTVRTFFLDSAAQFEPSPAISYSADTASAFYILAKEVYDQSVNLNDEKKYIALYWDCNPFANFYSGHVGVAIKKLSPGGHWMNITGITCRTAGASFSKTVYAHALVATGLHDGFVSCWNEKYRSNRLRPKTAINRLINESWNPLLETPPFPEYTSGHSVISTVSATMLTFLFGENFEFTDNTEVMFGMQTRTFPSFRAAANEAAISRMYGGIHYLDAIENGQMEGEEIGKFIISKINTVSGLVTE